VSLLQIGSFAIHGQGHHGIFYERVGHRVNLKSGVSRGACAPGGLCIDSEEDRYRISFRGCGSMAAAQNVMTQLWAQICPEEGHSYFRRRITEDANLEVYRLRSGKIELSDFRFQFTPQRTLVADVTLEWEHLPAAELSSVVSGDIEVGP
jgi:hypothetical protein